MHWLIKYNTRGTSLIELIISLAIFACIAGSLLSLYNVALKATADDKARNGALAIAQAKAEIIKNLPYTDVGLIDGLPSGIIQEHETVIINSINYAITTKIRYIDDSFDGTASSGDLLPTDYKQVKISVSWPSRTSTEPIVLTTNIAPSGIEQQEFGDSGTLWIEVYDSQPLAIQDATVSVINNETTPVINVTGETDNNGYFILPGAPISTQTYQISVTKNGYSTSQTYSVDPMNNPNPVPAHLSIEKDTVTTKSFFIDTLSNLNISVQAYATGSPIASFPFILQGIKTIGTNGEGEPIYKNVHESTSNGSGFIALENIENDTFSLLIDNQSTGYDLAGSSVSFPYVLSPGTTTDIILQLATHADNTLLVEVKDTSNSPIEDAHIRLYKTDLTVDITQDTNNYGQTFFTPVISDTYNLSASKIGFIENITILNVNNQTKQTFTLSNS